MKLINSLGEATKYNDKSIYILFNNLSEFEIKINRFEDIIELKQNSTFKYPLSYRIVYPTINVLNYFKTGGIKC